MSTWEDEQTSYWDKVSRDYDSLYLSKWSKLEDEFVAALIRSMITDSNIHVSDFGCGTGFGGRVVKQCAARAHYTGIDISSRMLEIAESSVKMAQARFLNRTMANVPEIQSKSQDMVLCLFTALSFVEFPNAAILEMARVLKPGGQLLISALSRYSLSRAIKGSFARTAYYSTRNEVDEQPPLAHFISSAQLENMARMAGLLSAKALAVSAFGGVAELPLLWPIDRMVCHLIPNLGHMIFLTAVKP